MSETPKVITVMGDPPNADSISQAADVLRKGGLVAFPTETVYGLGADSTNPEAIKRLNQVKGRPPEKPYSLNIYSPEQLRSYVTSVPPLAARLMERFWPGPLTIVIQGKDGKTFGFRLPDHPIAMAFLKACGVPVVAPSANKSGCAPPTDAHEVLSALDASFDCLLDGGPTRFGRESTVVEVIEGRLEIHREGAISRETILGVAKT